LSPTRANAAPLQVDLNDPAVRVGHLLRRAGFGATPAERQQYVALASSNGISAVVDQLLNYLQVPDAADAKLLALAINPLNSASDLQRWWLVRMRYTSRPLQEKMVYFWSSILTSDLAKCSLSQLKNQNDLFRNNALGKYDDMLKAISVDPAMMNYLDTVTSSVGRPNENYSRELMELFSMGQNNGYTQQDVVEGARAFTGYRIDPLTQNSYLNPSLHDNTNKTFLGKTGNWDANSIVDIIMNDATQYSAPYICTRLWRFFAHTDPSPTMLSNLVAIFQSSVTGFPTAANPSGKTGKFDVGKVVEAILKSDEFYSPAVYRAGIKSPAELIVTAIRNLGLDLDDGASQLPDQCRRLGEQLFNPPDVAGYPGGVAWISNTTYFNRMNFFDRVVRPNSPAVNPPLNTANITAALGSNQTAGGLTDYLLTLIVDGPNSVQPASRQLIIDYIAGATNAAASTPLPTGSTLDTKVRGAVYLALALPENQLS
jgi:uncharacterized protein (DUF1800 family)